jgi:hypothetical protein
MTDHEGSRRSKLALAADMAVGLFLFAATAGIIWWQNTRLVVLYDLSGVLEPAYRIALGELPYRDFPFPYAPLTFLTQAAIIRYTGAVYWHHIAYVCIVGGLATVLTWRILLHLLKEAVPRPRFTAFLLSLPVVILGVYCIFPHPFYDPDTCFVVLAAILLLLNAEGRGFPVFLTLAAGVLTVVPLFVKQNIGIAFLGGFLLWLAVAIVVNLRRKMTVRPYLLLFSGVILGSIVALAAVHFSFGLENYKHWTIDFAAARRTPSVADMLSVYADRSLILWLALFFLGAFVFRQNAGLKKWPWAISLPLMAMPFIWPVIYLFLDGDASERAERLVGLWPLSMLALFGLAYISVRRLRGVAACLPIILIATVHGVFLSQQLWGSTYGIWPLLAVILVLILRSLYEPAPFGPGKGVTILAGVIAASLCISGAFYVLSNERLDYVDFSDGEMAHSTLPQLAGMSMRGDWLPGFDELVRYVDKNIPPDDGILNLPGEDLFFYATHRRPHFPVMLFDVTNNPFSPAEIRDRVVAGDIEWVIVKDDTQIEADTMIDSKAAIFDLIKPYFRNVESLNNYEIYKRRHADDPPDDEDDNDSDDGSDDPAN